MKKTIIIVGICIALIATIALTRYKKDTAGQGGATNTIINSETERANIIEQGKADGFAMDGSKKDFILLIRRYDTCAKELSTDALAEYLRRYLDGFIDLYSNYKANCQPVQ